MLVKHISEQVMNQFKDENVKTKTQHHTCPLINLSILVLGKIDHENFYFSKCHKLEECVTFKKS